jgi:hypothetical protein
VRSAGRCEGTFLTREPTFSIAQYYLKNSAILDSGATIHILNEISHFLRFRPAESSDFVWAGEDKVRIQGYGNVDVEIQSPKGKQILRLFDVAFYPDSACNSVSLRLLHRQGYWWDNRPGFNNLRRANDDTIVALMGKHYGQFVLEHQIKPFQQFVLEYLPENLSKSAFFTRRNRFNS